MLDVAHSNLPERRSVLIAHELSRLSVDIATLSKVRFQEKVASKSMAPDTPSSGQRNLQQRGAFQALVSWSPPSSPPGWKICQLVIPTAGCPCAVL